VCVIISL
jgi:hypothetical protein